MVGPGEVPKRAPQLAAEYAAAVGSEALSLPATAAEIGPVITSLAVSVEAAERSLATMKRVAAGLSSEYIPSVLAARTAAYDIGVSAGQFTPIDGSSLALAGEGLQDIYEYFAPFVVPRDARLPDDMPPLTLKTFPRIKGAMTDGRDAYVRAIYPTTEVISLELPDFPEYSFGLDVPVLFDPTTYSLGEFRKLSVERADGHADQVAEGWERFREESAGSSAAGREPLVMRAIAVLPAPPSKESGIGIDFLPMVGLAREDEALPKERAYDVRLLVRGDSNLGGDYLKYGEILTRDMRKGVYAMGANGRRAPLQVRPAEDVGEQVDPLSSVTPRSQGAIALYMIPHSVRKNHGVEPGITEPLSANGPVIMRAIGGASVDVGSSTWMRAEKRATDSQDVVAPLTNRRPIIVSMQLFTMGA